MGPATPTFAPPTAVAREDIHGPTACPAKVKAWLTKVGAERILRATKGAGSRRVGAPFASALPRKEVAAALIGAGTTRGGILGLSTGSNPLTPDAPWVARPLMVPRLVKDGEVGPLYGPRPGSTARDGVLAPCRPGGVAPEVGLRLKTPPRRTDTARPPNEAPLLPEVGVMVARRGAGALWGINNEVARATNGPFARPNVAPAAPNTTVAPLAPPRRPAPPEGPSIGA